MVKTCQRQTLVIAIFEVQTSRTLVFSVYSAVGWTWDGNKAGAAAWIENEVGSEVWLKALFDLGVGALIAGIAIATPVTLLGASIARIALLDLKELYFVAPIRKTAIAIASFGGTSFYGSDLTNADFTEAELKNSDLRNASLAQTRWFNTQVLNHVRVGETYLKDKPIRELVVTGKGENANFDRQDLRGINLQDANLQHASFIDTDFSQANLQRVRLSEAKLVRTNLDQADLRDACLTGAYIEDWGITRKTILDGVECKYVYLNLPTDGDRDPNRMPPPEQGGL